MARAHRIHVPGHVWHLTHRCHHRRFLLQFARDRRVWRAWLYEARRRFGLCVLDYTVTANHVHLLVRDRGQDEIAASMHLIQGCTGQAYNRRKRRSGAFWADQYHATAVETGTHLARCVVYIDLNMVRAGVVEHPAAWEVGGYHEIQQARARYRIIDRAALAEALGVALPALADVHRHWVEAALRDGHGQRDRRWTDSVGVGSRGFVAALQHDLGQRGRYRAIAADGDRYVLRDAAAAYGRHSAGETAPPSEKSAPSGGPVSRHFADLPRCHPTEQPRSTHRRGDLRAAVPGLRRQPHRVVNPTAPKPWRPHAPRTLPFRPGSVLRTVA